MNPRNQVTKTSLMACPVCNLSIQATVLYDLDLTPAEVTPGFELKVDVRPKMAAFNVSHFCPGRAEATAEASA